MYPRSDEAAKLVRQSHSVVSILDVLYDAKPVYRLAFTAGSVGVEGGRSITRNFSGTVIDPSGEMSGKDMRDLLSPYECEVMPWRGVLLSDGSEELAPQGVFRLTNRGVGDFNTLSVTGQDRAIIYQGPMDSPLAISGGTPVETAIRKLLVTRNRALKMYDWSTGFTCGPLLFQPDTNVWEAALELAKSVGGFLAHDRHGELVFGPFLPVSDNPVATYAYGDGVLINATRSEDSDSIHNVVVVESAKAGAAGVIRAIAEDTDPLSPTFARGAFGRRVVKTITNQHIGSVTQAQQVAQTELVRELGKTETSVVTVIPDPWLDPNEVIICDYPTKGLFQRSLIIAGFSVPLGVGDGGMPLDCRKSIVGRDGRVIDNGGDMT